MTTHGDKMSTKNTVSRNFLALGSGEVVSRLIAFCTAIYLARVLGAENYGIIAFAIGVTLYLSKIADFSIEVIGTKEIAKDPKNSNITIMGLAYDCGFNSKTVFNTYFKKATGQTPKQYLSN